MKQTAANQYFLSSEQNLSIVQAQANWQRMVYPQSSGITVNVLHKICKQATEVRKAAHQ